MTLTTIEFILWASTILFHYAVLFSMLTPGWLSLQIESIRSHSTIDYVVDYSPRPYTVEWRGELLKTHLITKIRNQVGLHTLTLFLNWGVLAFVLYSHPHEFERSVELVTFYLLSAFMVSTRYYTEKALRIEKKSDKLAEGVYRVDLDIQYKLNVKVVKILQASFFLILQVVVYFMILPQTN